MNTIELDVQGMTCGSCVKHVTKVLQSISGVRHVEVDLVSGRAQVDGDFQAGAATLIEALAREDYPAKLVGAVATIQPSMTADGLPNAGSKKRCCCG